jgi:membrane associated rhomboid family serine protease
MNIVRRPFAYRNSGVVYWLIGINVLIFAAAYFLVRNTGAYLGALLAMRPFMVLRGWVWTFVTYMFMHDVRGISHILFNMLGLLIFGIPVERQMGSREFLLYYLLTGILAGLFSFFVYLFTGANIALMGASGALFAVELAYAVFFPDSIIYIWGIIPLRAPIMVLGYTAVELISSITGINRGVAHFTHLAGFGFGWLYFLVRFGMNPWRRLTGR